MVGRFAVIGETTCWRIHLCLCRSEKKSDFGMGRIKQLTVSTAKHGKQSKGQRAHTEKLREAKKRRGKNVEAGDAVAAEVTTLSVDENGNAGSSLASDNGRPSQPTLF